MDNAAKFGKPVLLVYGDSHTYSSGRPFPTKVPNVISLQVPGEKQMHAVSVTIDTGTTACSNLNHFESGAGCITIIQIKRAVRSHRPLLYFELKRL